MSTSFRPRPRAACSCSIPSNGRLLKISPEGVATRVRSLVGFPNALSTPAVDRKGHLLMFAGTNNEIIAPSSIEDAAQAKPPQVNYPAMLIFCRPQHHHHRPRIDHRVPGLRDPAPAPAAPAAARGRGRMGQLRLRLGGIAAVEDSREALAVIIRHSPTPTPTPR